MICQFFRFDIHILWNVATLGVVGRSKAGPHGGGGETKMAKLDIFSQRGVPNCGPWFGKCGQNFQKKKTKTESFAVPNADNCNSYSTCLILNLPYTCKARMILTVFGILLISKKLYFGIIHLIVFYFLNSSIEFFRNSSWAGNLDKFA